MRTLVAAAVACLTAIGLSQAGETEASVKKAVSIPAQDLGTALQSFAQERQLYLIYASQDVTTLQSRGASGELTQDEALGTLLNGTGLTFRYLDDKTVSILPLATAPSNSPSQSHHRAGSRTSQVLSESPLQSDVSTSASNEGASPKSLWQKLRLAQADSASAENSAESAPKSAGGSESAKLEEVIVTARRREESQQKVPVAMTVVSQQVLKENNVTTLAELQYLVPSLSGVSDGSSDVMVLSIRGQGQGVTTGQPGVIAYMNEVPIPSSQISGGVNAGPGLLFDLENVQALKGPQGTLFGRNSAGGALLLQSARPTDELGGRMQVGFGNYDNREVDGAVNLPIVPDVLLTRVAFAGQWRDGFTRLQGDPSHPDGRDVNDRDTWSLRATVAFHPGERFQNDTIATYTEYTSRGSPNFLTDVNPAGLAQFVSTLASPTFTYADALAQQRALPTDVHVPIDTDIASEGSSLLLSNKSTFALTDKLSLRNILGYSVAKLGRAYDSDSTALPIFQSSVDMETIRQVTEELQLLGQSFDDRLEWIVGAFYLEQRLPDEFVHGVSTALFSPPTESGTKNSEKGKALFMQGTYNLLTNLKGTVGFRYTEDERFSCGYTGPRANAACGNISQADSNALTWTLGLDYQATSDTLLYLASRRGYRAGGSNGVDPNVGRLPDFDPEYVIDYELGIKSDWEVGRVPIRTNAAVYYQDYSDIQVQTFVTNLGPPPGVFLTDNAAAARLWGVELEALAQLTENLQFGVTYDHLDFKYTEFDASVPEDQILQLGFRQKTNRPPNKYGLSVRYRLPVASTVGKVTAQANWNWQEASGDRDQSVGAPIDAFGLLNLAINLNDVAGRPLDISLYGSNVLDEEYVTGGFGLYSAFGAVVQRYGEPRMYGVRVNYRFGE